MADKKPSKTNLLLDERDFKPEKAETPLDFLCEYKLRYYTLIGSYMYNTVANLVENARGKFLLSDCASCLLWARYVATKIKLWGLKLHLTQMLFSMMNLDAYKVDPIKVLEAIVTARQQASEITVFYGNAMAEGSADTILYGILNKLWIAELRY